MKTALTSKTPLSVFLYNRPEHSERLFQSLSACRRLDECALHVYCDAPRDPSAAAQVAATRLVAKAWCERLGGNLVEREKNVGCAASIVSEAATHCQQSGRVIVLEDDLMVHPEFLNFMLGGLDRYEHEEQVFQVCGFLLGEPQPIRQDVLFLPFTHSWGWATWQRAWRHFTFQPDLVALGLQSERGRWRYNLRGSFHWAETLIKAMQGRGDIWDAYWYAAAYKHGAVTLYPRVSLVVNNGWDGSGLHCGARPRYGIAMNLNPEWPPFPSAIDWPRQAEANQAAYRRVQKYLRRQEKLWKRRPSLLARIRGRVSPFVPDWLKTSLRMVRPKGRQPDGGDS